jgi:phosphoribosylformylglycinamidine synthase PurS subunit
MKATVTVHLKNGVLDPQGKAIAHALQGLGYSEANDARVGKIIELELEETDRARAEARVKEMCERLLANTVIESYKIALQS